MRLSVIIPVYNVKHTLERCVKSVLSQGYQDCEIILVDDGSPDGSGELCDMLATTDKRIRTIHKDNGGLSDARNKGLETAVGDYVTFVDSDDFISENTYVPLMKIVEAHPEYDILEFPVFVFYGSKEKQHKLVFEEETYSDTTGYWLKGKAYSHSYAWNKIYKRTLFDHARFPKGIIFEDMHTLPQLLKNAKTVATTNVGLYYYCWNPSGITATADGKALESLLTAHLNVIDNFNKEDFHLTGFPSYYMHVLNIQCDVCRLTSSKPILPTIKFGFFKPLIDMIRTENKITVAKFIAYSITGVKGLCTINKLQHKI